MAHNISMGGRSKKRKNSRLPLSNEAIMMRPANPIHPGQMLLQEFLLPSQISQRQFAATLGWTAAKLNELIKGKRGITADSALDLSKALKTSPELWLNLQMQRDLAEAEKRRREAS